MLVYFLMAMVLYGNVAYQEVLRLVLEGLRSVLGDEELSRAMVTKGAISQARGQVGVEPLRRLYHEQVQPHGPADMPGVCYAGLRVMALDGSTLDLPDETANAQHFGYPGASRGSAAFPQLRFVAMAECGTHTLCFAHPGPYATSEQELARTVIARADRTMLVTADRNFYSHAFWQQALATGATLLFRVKRNLRLPRERELADGSYLSTLYASDKDRRRQANGTTVRVIEYALEGLAEGASSER